MAKTYNLQGPIILENLTNAQALGFVATVIAEVPAHAMGTASVNIRAQGPAGSAAQGWSARGWPTAGTTVSGNSLDALKASLAKAQGAAKGPEDIVYDVRGCVNLVGMSHAECLDLIDTVMGAIAVDSLVVTGMTVIQEV
jgi:hypothetical protein